MYANVRPPSTMRNHFTKTSTNFNSIRIECYLFFSYAPSILFQECNGIQNAKCIFTDAFLKPIINWRRRKVTCA